ncbi:MAG: DNA polymerase III subunit delta [SAR202 cluster bacterium Io17-Chloro-G9]|nr:MAG: DNA polymerase III subunit delta [SAR202 cluster bacterium Io17-Chloro-G9]
MPAHVLYGDSFLVAREQHQLEFAAGGEQLLDANRHRLTGAGLNLAQLTEFCAAVPFMDTVRLVLVDGLLATLEGRRSSRRTRRQGNQRGNRTGRTGNAQNDPGVEASNPWDGLEQAIVGMPPTTLLIFTEAQISENNPLLQALKPVAQIRNLAAPKGEGLARWIKNAAQEKEATISPAAIASLANLAGNDLRSLDHELEKLALYCWGRTIEESDVTDLVFLAKEANIFATVDAMVEGRRAQALQLVRKLREDGQDPSYIIAMVERQLRMLALAWDALNPGVNRQKANEKELAERLGTSSPFVVRKTMDQARKHSWQDIKWRYERLLEADLSIKQGRLEPDVALEMLVADQASLIKN